MFDHILLPTDGSKEVNTAVEVGLDLAQTYEATLHALYVVEETPTIGYGMGTGRQDELLEGLKQEGKDITEEIEGRAEQHAVEMETAVRQGTPRRDILTYAEDLDIDLIVMGTHGRTGVKRFLLGSVTEGVVRHAGIPVLTVSRDSDAD